MSGRWLTARSFLMVGCLVCRKNMKATDGLIQGLEETIHATVSKVEETEAIVGELEAALQDKYPNMELAKHRFTARTYGSNPAPER
jgi:hypothetical protein